MPGLVLSSKAALRDSTARFRAGRRLDHNKVALRITSPQKLPGGAVPPVANARGTQEEGRITAPANDNRFPFQRPRY